MRIETSKEMALGWKGVTFLTAIPVSETDLLHNSYEELPP